ncbi:MAG: c-type cytochrome [Candidatus Rokuibacteriota bacterium]
MSARPGALALVAAVLGLAASASGQPAELAQGERIFRDNCAVCHGEAGNGRGMAAHHFKMPPRDLTKGRFKFRSTASGQVPTDADLARTIVEGIPSTGMVPQNHLSPAEVRAVIEFIKSLSPRFAQAPAPRLAPIPAATATTPEAIARGAKIYVKGECAECHGREARGDGPSAKDLSVKPSDLTRRPLKSGPTAGDIVRTLVTGLDGTPMPSYYQVLEDDELWDLAYWLAARGGAPETTDDERAGWHVVQMHQRRGR